MDQSFDRSRRLLTHSDYQYVFDAPEKRSSDRYFTVLGRCRVEPCSRLGLIIAKRNIARAHERNRVKRLARESFRLEMAREFNMDIVLLAKHAAQHADNSEIFASLVRHWKRLQR
ncbi:ribonuclease P protein component [Cardiobacteriaceae bacterium TAE3-ERU3]|nr:ribonuclease P protein component [Cardiobacteriaceae bacterium TAE3-ERU3]